MTAPEDALLRLGRFFARAEISPDLRAVVPQTAAATATSSTGTAGATTRSSAPRTA